MADLVTRLSVDTRGFTQNMEAAAASVESTTARMNRAVATIDQTSRRFDTLDRNAKTINRSLNDAAGALSLFGGQGAAVSQQIAPISNALMGVADAAATVGTVLRGGAGAIGFSSIVPVIGAVVAAATALYGVYRLLRPATETVATAESEYQQALRLSEPFVRSAAEASAELERQKRAEAAARVEAAQATLQEALAQRQADLAFAQAAAAEAARQAERPARRGTLRGGVIAQALSNAGATEREITADIARLNEQLATLASRLTAINTPAATTAQGLRTAAAAAESLEQVLARLRNSAAGQTYAAGLTEANQAGQEAGAIIEQNLTAYERYGQELERIGRASEVIFQRQGEVQGQATIERATERALETLRQQENQTQASANAARDLGLSFSSAFEDAVVGGKKLSDVLRGLSADLARIIVRRSITEPLAGAASSAFSGIGSSIGTFFSGLFGGARAMGGPVASGVPYLVGERGPELFVPGSAGEIMPGGGFGGGGSIAISNNVTVDARGSSIGPAELRAAVIAGIAAAEERTMQRFRRDPAMRALAQGRA